MKTVTGFNFFTARRSTSWVRFAIGAWLGVVGGALHGQESFADDVRRGGSTNTAPVTLPKSTPAPKRSVSETNAAMTTKSATVRAAADPRFAKAAQAETEDFSVAPIEQLRGEPFHAPTPTRIPGAQVISTQTLAEYYQKNDRPFLVFDVLGDAQGLPNAQNALPAARGNSFTDQTQRDFGNYLQQVTQGRKDVPLIFYCQSVQCWMSYNAALRAVRLGYTQVYWYRGGIEAWEAAGLPLVRRQ